MELIIAVVLFIAIVAVWIILPSSPAEQAAPSASGAVPAGSAGHTA